MGDSIARTMASAALLAAMFGVWESYPSDRHGAISPQNLDGMVFSERGEQRTVDHAYYRPDGAIGLVTYHTPSGRSWATGDEWREWVR